MLSHKRNDRTFFIVLHLASLFASVSAQRPFPACFDSGNYTNNSTYQINLRTILSNLSTNIDQNGFYNASVGQSPQRVHATVLCTGDIQLDECRSCIRNATADLLQACPNEMQAIFWHMLCIIHYSNTSIVENLDTINARFFWLQWWNGVNSTRPDEFMSDLGILLENIRNQASNGDSLRKVAYGSTRTVGFQTIYALEQCAPYLSKENCLTCLSRAAHIVPRQFYGATEVWIVLASCNLRYRISPFYNETRLLELAVSPSGKGRSTGTIIIVVSTVVGIIIVILIGFLIWRMSLKKSKKESETEMDNISISECESLQYDFSLIQAATNDFSMDNKLGQGGFGAVYRGKLSDGGEIAVKRLSRDSGQGDLEFKNEVMLLAKLQHRNLVRLFGFSIKGPEKLLVYEFVENASLDQLIFHADPSRRSQLNWDTRYKIIGGIARGILYLHEDSRLRIIHRDLKASNVLLDRQMNAKIADFGMARLLIPDETQANTSRIVGTYGYMAPEYAAWGQFSVKSDVFSFGMLLLEIISGQKKNYIQHGETTEDLVSNAWGNWHSGTAAENLVDPVLMAGSDIPEDILRCIHIGFLCVQAKASERPTMASVVVMLTNFSVTLPVVSPPAYVHHLYDLEYPLFPESNIRTFQKSIVDEGAETGVSRSLNQMSISDFNAR